MDLCIKTENFIAKSLKNQNGNISAICPNQELGEGAQDSQFGTLQDLFWKKSQNANNENLHICMS